MKDTKELFNKRIAIFAGILFVLGISLSGCGLPKEADLSDVENTVTGQIDEFDQVFTGFDRLENTRSIYYCHYGENNGKWCLADEETSSETVISEEDEDYGDIIAFLAEHECSSIYRSNGCLFIEGIINPADENYCEIMKSDEPPESVAVPYWDAGQDVELMNWERAVDGNKVTFTADHRKDKSGYHKGMYYRIDMKLLDRGIYIAETQKKFPWYSAFIS